MLIYGIKKVDIGSSNPTYPTCIHCKQQGTMEMNYTSNHFHIFWIPMFPYRRKFTATCSNCQKKTKKKDFSEPLLREYYQLKSSIKTPLWQFSGLAVIIVLVALAFYQSDKNDIKKLDYLNNPKVGDVYKQKLENGHYTMLKVVSISKDSLLISPNIKEINKILKINRIDRDANYSNETFNISKKDVKSMFESKEIYGIKRN